MNRSFLQILLRSSRNRASMSIANRSSKYLKGLLVLVCCALTAFPAMAQPTTAAPTPTVAAANVISMFSDAYTDVPVDTWLTAWSGAAGGNIVPIAGNDTRLYTSVDFLGIETVTNPIDASGMTFFNIDVWTPDMTTFRVKLVNFDASAGNSEGEIAFTPIQSGWNTFQIPMADFFDGALTTGSALTSATNISQLILSGLPTGGGMMYIDNVYFSAPAIDPNVPAVAAPNPTCDAANVISMFSGVYTDVPVDTWLTPWSAASGGGIVPISGNDTRLYENVDFLGIETVANQIDASGMMFFNIDVWTPNMTTFRVKLVDFGPGGNSEGEIAFTPVQMGWNTYSIPMADFFNASLTTGPALGNSTNIAQLILSGQPIGGGTMYIDNVYFSNCLPTEPVAAAPTPTCDAADVISMFSDAYTDVPVDTWLTFWSGAAGGNIVPVAGNDTRLYTAVDFLGIETVTNPIDASGMMFFNIDVWTPDMTTFRVKLVNFDASAGNSEGEIAFTPVQSGWNTFQIPMADFFDASLTTGPALTSSTNISQLILSGQPVAAGTMYIDNVYYSNCAVPVPVTFCVDLNCVPSGGAAAAVAGSFNGFNPGTDFLSDADGDGVYCGTVDVAPGVQTFRFFTAGEQFEDLSGIAGQACAAGTTPELREITVVSGVPQTVTYAWESCAADCAAAPTADITFCVDLSCATSNAAAAVAGSFNGDNPGTNFLFDADGDGVFCGTVAVPEGDHTFRFFNAGDQFEDLSAIAGEACVTGMAPNVRRAITVVAGVAQTVTYGWELCDAACPPPLPGPDFPIIFDDCDVVDHGLSNFGGMSSVLAADPLDPTNKVVCATKEVGATCFGGTTINVNGLQNPIPFGPGNTVITVDVFSPNVGTPFLLKIESTTGGPSAEVLVFSTVANAWETLFFNFALDPAFSLSNTYDRVVFFPEFTCGNTDAPGSGITYYFDNIMMCVGALPEITCPAAVTISCEASTDPADTGMATTVEICGALPAITFADADDQTTTGCGQHSYTITRTWTATDLAGNSTACEQIITVEDTTPPVLTCPAEASIECDGDSTPAGTGMAIATDNCSSGTDLVVSFTDASTQGTDGCAQFEYVITRTWTVVDACGLTASCDQVINVGSTTPATVTCPDDEMLSCNQTPPAFGDTPEEFLAIGGTLSDNCSSDLANFTISHSDDTSVGFLDFCPSAAAADRTIIRTYTITNACGNVTTCTQNFVFGTSDIGPVITSIPLDQTVDCAVNAIAQEHLFVAEGTCSNISYTVSGPSSNGTAGCPGNTIQYIYTATDQCGRFVTHVQTYTLANEGPEFVCPVDICVIECPADTDMIQAQFDAYAGLATVISSCSESSISIGNNFNPNGFIPQNCMNPIVQVDGAVAYQIVTFTAVDDCGRNAACTAMVVIKDGEAPVMEGSVSVGVADCNDADLQADYTNWAMSQINGLAASDECSGVTPTLSYAPLSPNVDCSSGLATTVVSFTAVDACGNATTLTANYQIIDNGGGEPAMSTVAGTLMTEENETIALAEVEVDGFSNNMMMTNTDGYYHFDLMSSQNYAVAPSRNDNPLNGITTYDLILLGQHLLEINLLDSPYKLIAADVNESGSVTALDMIELRRVILHIDDQFSSGKSWTFVDAGFVFPQPTNPFATTYPTVYNINNLTASQIVDFIGVKLGDLNASASPNLLQTGDTRSSDGSLKIKLEDELLKAGQTYQLAFNASDFNEVAGFQFTLDFAADYLELMDYEGSELSNMSANNFGFTKANEGKITVSWNETQSVNMSDDATLFQVSFTALKDVPLSEVIAINSSVTANEAYQADLRKDVVLDFGDAMANKGFTLLQNQPNPFSQETVIGFQLPEASEATLTIYDVSGRVVFTRTNTYDAGMHQVMMDKADLGATGVLYYQLSTPEFNETKKMIVLK